MISVRPRRLQGRINQMWNGLEVIGRAWSINLVFRVVRPSSKLVLINYPDSSFNDGTLVELALLLLMCRFCSCEDGIRFRTAHVPARRVSVDDKEGEEEAAYFAAR